MTVVVAFIRHGDFGRPDGVPSAHSPHPLTKEGEGQAADAVAGILDFAASHKLTLAPKIHVSNLLRAWQTGAIVADGLSEKTVQTFELEGTDALAERSLGSAANLTVEEINRVMAADPRFETPPDNWKATSDYLLPLMGAESLIDAGRRVAAYVSNSIAASVGENILHLFIGHGAAFRHAAVEMGALQLSEVQGLSMYHCRPVYLAPSSEGRWGLFGGAWKVRKSPAQAMD